MAPKDGLKRCHVTELKSLASPPVLVNKVGAATVVLLGEYHVNGETNGHLLHKQTPFAFKKSLANPNILNRMKDLDASTLSPQQLRVARECAHDVSLESVSKANLAAAFLLRWVLKILHDANPSA